MPMTCTVDIFIYPQQYYFAIFDSYRKLITLFWVHTHAQIQSHLEIAINMFKKGGFVIHTSFLSASTYSTQPLSPVVTPTGSTQIGKTCLVPSATKI